MQLDGHGRELYAANLPEIGLASSSLLKATLPELIDTAARHNFRRITARPYAFAEAMQNGWNAVGLRRKLVATDVEVTMIDALTNVLPGVPSPESLDPSRRAGMPPDVLYPVDEETVLRAADVLGASIINLTHYLGEPTPIDRLAEAVAVICQRAAERGLSVGLEFIPGTGLPDLPFTQQVVEECGEANCGITLDLFHLDCSGGTLADVARLPQGAIVGVQISDRESAPSGRLHAPFGGRCLPGEGSLPVNDLVRAAFDNSAAATLDIEVLNDELASLRTEEAAARLEAGVQSWLAAP